MQFTELDRGVTYAIHATREEQGTMYLFPGVFTGGKKKATLPAKGDYSYGDVTVTGAVFRVAVSAERAQAVADLIAAEKAAHESYDEGFAIINRVLTSLDVPLFMDGADIEAPVSSRYADAAPGELHWTADRLINSWWDYEVDTAGNRQRVTKQQLQFNHGELQYLRRLTEDDAKMPTADQVFAQVLLAYVLGEVPAIDEALALLDSLDESLAPAIRQIMESSFTISNHPHALNSKLHTVLKDEYGYTSGDPRRHFLHVHNNDLMMWVEAKYIQYTWDYIATEQERQRKLAEEHEAKVAEEKRQTQVAIEEFKLLGLPTDSLPGDIGDLLKDSDPRYRWRDVEVVKWVTRVLLPHVGAGIPAVAPERLSDALEVAVALGDQVAALEAHSAAQATLVDNLDKGRDHLINVRDGLCDRVASLTDALEAAEARIAMLQADVDAEPVTITIRIDGGRVVVQ